MANKDLVLDFLLSISPQTATNTDIVGATGIEPHPQVYQLTQRLKREGLIEGEQRGREWFFWVLEGSSLPRQPPSQPPSRPVTARQFEALAGRVLSAHYGVPLMARSVPHHPKKFDLVSPDGSVVGDAKYYTRVRGKRWPSAKMATISEHVWLLGHTGAVEKFLVFGNDREVPIMWLHRYGALLSGITFYFLTDDGDLEELVNPSTEAA
jgi:hypothetical protein